MTSMLRVPELINMMLSLINCPTCICQLVAPATLKAQLLCIKLDCRSNTWGSCRYGVWGGLIYVTLPLLETRPFLCQTLVFQVARHQFFRWNFHSSLTATIFHFFFVFILKMSSPIGIGSPSFNSYQLSLGYWMPTIKLGSIFHPTLL